MDEELTERILNDSDDTDSINDFLLDRAIVRVLEGSLIAGLYFSLGGLLLLTHSITGEQVSLLVDLVSFSTAVGSISVGVYTLAKWYSD